MYEVNAASACALYGDFLQASGQELIVLLSSGPLSAAALDALHKSAAALGYHARTCAQMTTTSCDGLTLGANDLMSALEGIDPLALVATDAQASALLGKAYRCTVAPNAATRVMGRTVVAFFDFESMLSSASEKQKAWALLKKLPRL